MKKLFTKTICSFCITLLCNSSLTAQLNENFGDDDFTANPAWIGNTADWIVNAGQQLQSGNVTANSNFYLSTASNLATQTQWEFFVQLAFSTSGANYADIYLTASQSDLMQASTTGYFVRLGNTDDEICLYRKEANGSALKIIDGADGSIATSYNSVRIKVIRDVNNQWQLFRDNTGGTNFISEGAVTDATYLTSSFFGIFVKQSTASFFQKHFFDDISITNYVPDTTPPTLASAAATTANTLDVIFSESLDALTAEDINNYVVNGLGKPATAVINPSNPASVTLSFPSNFIVSTPYTITVNNVKDISGNALSNATSSFTWFVAGRYSIVIDEIFADPTPQVGLPNAEWIELRNTTPVAINLQNYRIGKTGSISGPLPSLLLQPDSFVIVTTASQVPPLSAFGRTISVTSFPSLSNDADEVFLQTNTGDVMHIVAYDVSWYQNNVKADGGWSLEMIDTHNPCAAATNWKASIDATGGTPGKKNSVDGVNADSEPPILLRAFASDNVTLTLSFNETLDSAKAAIPASYTVSDGIGGVQMALPQGPLFNKVTVLLNTPLAANKVYTVTVSGVADCSGNTIGGANTAKVGLASSADSLDLIVNEILFNPKDFGVDYLELYNRSNKIIDLSTISIANRSSSTGAIGAPVKVSVDNYLLFPGGFVALTTEPLTVQSEYVVKNPDALMTVLLPSFPDTEGSAIVLNNQGEIVDELNYDDSWHFALLDNSEGVSLERIDYNRPTNEASNWTSAASTAGFGTPGYINSQYRSDLTPQGEMTIEPKMFSPDNDGYEDFAFIHFRFPEPGYVVNIKIYDAAGRPVRLLQRNTTAAATSVFRWDGLDDKSQKVPVGTYIIYTDAFNLNGQKKQFKNTVVVAKKF
jgi:hypothetical protein